MTRRAPATVHLWHRPTASTAWCGRIIDRRSLADDITAVTCQLCIRSYVKAGRPVQQVLL